MSKDESTSIYTRKRDRDRLGKLADHDTRSPVDQLTVIIDEACDRRGLDRTAVKPIQSSEKQTA